MRPIRIAISLTADPAGFAVQYGDDFDQTRVLEVIANEVREMLISGVSYAPALNDVELSAMEVTDERDAKMYLQRQVIDALNQAADDILDAVDAGDEGLRDGLNLMVNATAFYLRHANEPNVDLSAVVDESYDETFDEVLSWIATCV